MTTESQIAMTTSPTVGEIMTPTTGERTSHPTSETDHPRRGDSDKASHLRGEFLAHREEYVRDTSELRRDINAFAMSILAAIWMMLQSKMIDGGAAAKMAILSCIATIAFGVLSKMFRIYHYLPILDDPSKPDDFRSSAFGIWGSRFATIQRLMIFVTTGMLVAAIVSAT